MTVAERNTDPSLTNPQAALFAAVQLMNQSPSLQVIRVAENFLNWLNESDNKPDRP